MQMKKGINHPIYIPLLHTTILFLIFTSVKHTRGLVLREDRKSRRISAPQFGHGLKSLGDYTHSMNPLYLSPPRSSLALYRSL